MRLLGAGGPANDPPTLGMLWLKPGVMQGVWGAMGAAPNPPVLGWEKSRGGWGAGPCPGGIHRPTSSVSIILLITAVSPQPLSQQSPLVTARCRPALGFPGVPLGAHPPILRMVCFAVSGHRCGRGEDQHHGRTAGGPACADPPSHSEEHPDPSPPSSFTSRLGPWEKEGKDELEPGRVAGDGEQRIKTTGKILYILRKCW